MSLDPTRRSQLVALKLRSLVGSVWGHTESEGLVAVPYFAGAAVFHEASAKLFVLVDVKEIDADPLDLAAQVPRPARGWLGGALVAAARRSAASIEILADPRSLDGSDARRAQVFSVPVMCSEIIGREIRKIVAVPLAEPAELSPTDVHLFDQFSSMIREAGATPVFELGILTAEVLGLEVARALSDEFGTHLAVGVGRHDRLAQSMMNAQVEPLVALRNAVDTVRSVRTSGVGPHPGNTVSRSRWVRDHLIAHPALVGADHLVSLAGTVAVELKRPSVAVCAGRTSAGQTVVVGCSVGADLDAIPDLLDVLETPGCHAVVGDESPNVILVVPTGDDLPAVRLLASLTRRPIEVAVIRPPWA